MVAETRVSTDDLIMPLFVDERLDAPMRIESMPGQFRHSIESLAREVEGLEELGVPAVILFGLPDKKDEVGSGAWDLAGVVQQAIERIKETTSKVVVIADLDQQSQGEQIGKRNKDEAPRATRSEFDLLVEHSHRDHSRQVHPHSDSRKLHLGLSAGHHAHEQK